MKKIEITHTNGHSSRQSIAGWVAEHLRYDDDTFDGVDPKNGIEDRQKRTEEFVGWLTDRLVQKGIIDGDEAIEALVGWARSHVEIVEEDED
jgi:hypothetical protein